ncbi:MAG: cupin domain-containing protein, partial [Thermoanaerobaculia bacterium]|nr:cupin domain-containing protein [Thermoanaerobaculia bacterium]
MRHFDASEPSKGFRVLGGSGRSQAATMILDPGRPTGGPGNRHPDSDQWLYVISGRGRAVVEGETAPLEPGSLV